MGAVAERGDAISLSDSSEPVVSAVSGVAGVPAPIDGGAVPSPSDPLDEEELATRAGTTVDKIRDLAKLGIIRLRGAGGSYAESDIVRARLAISLDGSGISLQDLGKGIEGGHVSMDFADFAVTAPISLLGKTYRQLAEEVGISQDLLAGIRWALGVSDASMDEPIREDDAELLRIAVRGVAQGFSDDILIRTLRVFSENVRRIVDFELELFRTEIERPLLEAGMSEQQMLDNMAMMRGQLEPVSIRLAYLLHRRHEEHAFFQDATEHIENAMTKAGLAERRAPRPPAIAFLEVSGYSRLSETRQEDPSDFPVRLGDIVLDSMAYGGRALSVLADLVMLTFPDPTQAVRCALHLVDRIAAAGLPTARVGMHAGPVVVRDGEYFGRTVNAARRIAEYARPGEVLVSAEVVAHCEPGPVSFEEIGPISLRGLAEPIALSLATPAT